jgi:hypothetical protein
MIAINQTQAQDNRIIPETIPAFPRLLVLTPLSILNASSNAAIAWVLKECANRPLNLN